MAAVLRISIVALAVVASLASASPTPYQRMDDEGYGVAEQRLDRGRWRIFVHVNHHTSRASARDYLHTRALELCRHDGFATYAIEHADSDVETSTSVFVSNNSRGVATAYGSTQREYDEQAVIRCQ